MTASHPSQVSHLCAVLAGQRVIMRVENPELVAIRLRTSVDTVYRMLNDHGEHRWTYPRLLDLASLERDVLNTGSIDEILDNRNRAFPTTAGDVNSAGRDALVQLSRRVADMAEAITTGGGFDEAELRSELNQLPEILATLQRFGAAAEAKLGRPS